MRTSAALISIQALSPALCADLVAVSRAANLAWRSGVACANKAAGVEKSASAQSLTRCLIVGPTANRAVQPIVPRCFARPKTELSMGRIGFFYGRTVIAVDSAKPVGQAIVF